MARRPAIKRPGETIRALADQRYNAMRDQSRCLAAVARVFDIKTEERAWRKGDQGEEAMGRRLERLRENGWQILHSVALGHRGSDIDHIPTGAGGVYTVDTKLHPGRRIWVGANSTRVNGQPVPTYATPGSKVSARGVSCRSPSGVRSMFVRYLSS